MDKNEYNVKLEEIKRCVDQNNFTDAAALADQIDWRRVRNIRTLCVISEVYEAVGRPEDSKELLLRAYRRSPVGRSILYRLVEVTIQLKQFDEAIEYYSEYAQASPHDTNNYILKYKIYRGRGSSLDEQIAILKEYLDQEYNEKYAYELAKLYQEADRIQDCLSACDDLVLWFQSGHYVVKALELKKRYAPLTAKQQEILEIELEREAAEAAEAESIGQEKTMVETEETSEADNIMEDTAREIAEAVKETVTAGTAQGAETAAPVTGDTRVIGADVTAAVSEGDAGSDADATKAFDIEAIRRARAMAALEQEVAAETAQTPAQEVQAVQETARSSVDEAETAQETADKAVEETSVSDAEEAAAPVAEESKISYDPETLQSDIARSMKEITQGVGSRDLTDPDEELVDEVIEQSKREQEQAAASRKAGDIRMNSQLRMPRTQTKAAAAKLSIDDVLLAMGEKGTAVREAAAKAAPARRAPQGVLSAVDEALLNMGMAAEDKDSKALQPESELPELSFDLPDTEDAGTEDISAQIMKEAAQDTAQAVAELKQKPADDLAADSEAKAEDTAKEAGESLAADLKTEVREDLTVNAKAEAEKDLAEDARAEVEKDLAVDAGAEVEKDLAVDAGAEAEEEQTADVKAEVGEELTVNVDTEAAEEPTVNAGTEAEDDLTEDFALEPEDDLTVDFEADAEDGLSLDLEIDREEDLATDPGQDVSDEDLQVEMPFMQDEESDLFDLPEDLAEQELPEDDADAVQAAAALQDDDTEASDKADAGPSLSVNEIYKASTRRMPTEEIREELKSGARRSARERAEERKQARAKRERREGELSAGVRGYFKGFTEVHDLEMQIAYAMEQSLAKGTDKTSRMGNILIFGSHGSGKTQIAVALAKALAKEQGKEFVKMAKIYSTDLNRKDIAATIAKIAGGVLVIEEAGDLSDSTADQLTTALEFRTDGLIVIMEDEERYLRDLLMRHPRLTMKFTSQIYIPRYTVDELVNFAELIAQEGDCTLSAAAADLLASRIEAQMDKGDVVSLLNIREMTQGAVNRSGKLGRKLFGGKKRYDDAGRVILLEKDFR